MDSATSPPTGTVTFLFTDIEEGSLPRFGAEGDSGGVTRLLQHLGDRYPAVLAEQQRLLRAAFEAGGGREFNTQGDSFCVAFASAPAALNAAVAAQRAVAAHPWPVDAPVRVRIGLHTGEPTLTQGDYVGLDVHRAARVSAAGHGGQIVLSQRSRDLVVDTLPGGVSLRDLGVHRLKDLLHPERLFQLVVEGLPADFPPLSSLESHPNNLPLQLSSFIGREQEIGEVKRRLATTRLLTLTGMGGTGKTRLSLQVAADLLEEYADGVWLVELAALSDEALLPQTVASAFHLREEPSRSPTDALVEYLRPRELLLLLDNCEHLVGACARLTETLLRSCPKLKVLATSREALGIVGENTWRLPSLTCPEVGSSNPHPTTLLQYEAVRLFIERGAAVQPSFTVTPQNALALAEVCNRLDGIPLALELAAARLKAMSVEKIGERLDDRFRLLTSGSRTATLGARQGFHPLPLARGPSRQQTLRAAIDWSYDLLSEAERSLLGRLSVFAAGCQLSAAEAVCAGDGIEEWELLDLLTSLVEKSLVQYEEPEGCSGRYRLLETIRQYADERLQTSDEGASLRERHRDWYLALAEEADPELNGPSQGEWLDRLAAEHENLRVALAWTATTEEAEVGLRLARALWQFWVMRGYATEGRQRLAEMLALPGAATRTLLRAGALNRAGHLAHYQGDYTASRALQEESLAISAELGDRTGVSAGLASLGLVALYEGDFATARTSYEKGLAINREQGDKPRIAVSLHNLGIVANRQGEMAAARAFLEESLVLLREAGNKRGVAYSLNELGNVALNQGDYAAARALFEESIAIKRELDDRSYLAPTLNNLGLIAMYQGDYETARAFYEEGLAIHRELGDQDGIALSHHSLGILARYRGDLETARTLYERSLSIRRDLGDRRGVANLLGDLGSLTAAQGELEAALPLLEESLAIEREIGDRSGVAGNLKSLGEIARRQGDPTAALAHHRESLRIERELGNRRGMTASLDGLAAVAAMQGEYERAARLLGAAEGLREAIGAALPPPDRAERERSVAAARAGLGEEASAAAWAEGRALSLDEAVALALQPSDAEKESSEDGGAARHPPLHPVP